MAILITDESFLISFKTILKCTEYEGQIDVVINMFDISIKQKLEVLFWKNVFQEKGLSSEVAALGL